MSWKGKISAPSFRGVPFEVESDEMTGGRRLATHTYPLREVSYTEDMGREPDSFTLSCFVCGPDYMTKRDKLMAALQEPGPGLLVHPQYGRIEVHTGKFRIVHSNDKRGMALFTIPCIRAGKAVNPGSSVRTQDVLFAKADAASTVSMDEVNRTYSVAGAPSFVTEETLQVLLDGAELLASGRPSIGDGAAYAQRVLQLTSLSSAEIGAFQPGTEFGQLFIEDGLTALEYMDNPSGRMRDMLDMLPSIPASIEPMHNTPARLQLTTNANGINKFLKQMAVSEAARSASGVVPETASDAVRMTREITEAIDEVLETTDNDAVFMAYTDLRAAAVRDMSERARQAKRIREFTPTMTGPALVMAHRACDAGAREVESLVRRNGIRHPGFVGVAPLEVIVDA